MSRFIGIFYNDSGTCAYLPIEASSIEVARKVADELALERAVGSGGNEFAADVVGVAGWNRIAANATNEADPYTAKQVLKGGAS